MGTEFAILGPVRAVRDGVPLAVGGPRQRAVLARLLIEPRAAVPADVLVEDVWDGDPPPTAAKILHKYVSQLRAILGRGLLVTAGRGYAIDGPDDAVDARRFERLLAAGDDAAALALFRGTPLADLPDAGFAVVERARLEELRLLAVERSTEARLRAGAAGELVAGLADLVERFPLRERLTGQLVRALYLSGRQAEALAVVAGHRRRLADELGVDPAEELVALESAILRHDPGLVPAPSTPGNLRPPASSFVGRAAEREEVGRALAAHRLVTLTGPGGVGKTRLAIESAAACAGRFPGGIWFADLATETGRGVVAHTVGVALGIPSQPGWDDEQTVVAALASREPLLLVLDNCEHLVEDCARFADRVVRTAAGVRLLATSRRSLGVDGECVRPVAPLPQDDVRALFADRARLAGLPEAEAAGPDAERICRSLDGLPLAVELAVGQLRVLGPAELAARLDERLRFAGTRVDAPPRHRTLRDMAAWSHALLPPATQAFAARLGVFASTLPLGGAAVVGGEPEPLPHVAALLDHSLLSREPVPGTDVRYRQLDTLRLFALERLRAAGTEEVTRRRHAEFYRSLCAETGSRLYGPDERAAEERLELEEPNLHVALDWAAQADPVLALRLGLVVWPYWDLRWREGFALPWFQRVLAAAGPVPDDVRAWVLTAMADLSANPGESRLATGWAEESVALFRALGDARGLATALTALGSARVNAGALDRAEAALAEATAVAAALGDDQLIVRGLNHRSFVARRRGDVGTAIRLGQQELSTWTALGSRRGEATALRHLAVDVRQAGDLDESARLCARALEIWEELGDAPSIAHVQTTLADVARLRGDLAGAERLYRTAFAELRRIGDRRCTASTYRNLAAIAADGGRPDAAAALYRDALRLRLELGDGAGLAECLDGLAAALAATGRPDDAVVLLGAADRRRADSGATASPEEAAVRRDVDTALRAVVPPGVRDELMARGRALSAEECVTVAVSSAPAPPAGPRPSPAR